MIADATVLAADKVTLFVLHKLLEAIASQYFVLLMIGFMLLCFKKLHKIHQSRSLLIYLKIILLKNVFTAATLNILVNSFDSKGLQHKGAPLTQPLGSTEPKKHTHTHAHWWQQHKTLRSICEIIKEQTI